MIESRDVQTIYEMPLAFHEQGLDDVVCRKLGLETNGAGPDGLAGDGATRPRAAATACASPSSASTRTSPTRYKSVQEALIHGGIANDVGVDIDVDLAATSSPTTAKALSC